MCVIFIPLLTITTISTSHNSSPTASYSSYWYPADTNNSRECVWSLISMSFEIRKTLFSTIFSWLRRWRTSSSFARENFQSLPLKLVCNMFHFIEFLSISGYESNTTSILVSCPFSIVCVLIAKTCSIEKNHYYDVF